MGSEDFLGKGRRLYKGIEGWNCEKQLQIVCVYGWVQEVEDENREVYVNEF